MEDAGPTGDSNTCFYAENRRLDNAPAVVIVVWGVSCAGKSTIGRALAHSVGYNFVDADDLHPKENVDKMASGVPLTDEDRLPWLDVVGAVASKRTPVVVACSALKAVYRRRLESAMSSRVQAVFVLLHLSREEAERRATSRTNHFMPPSLLPSQFAALEMPSEDEMESGRYKIQSMDGQSVSTIVNEILATLDLDRSEKGRNTVLS